MTSSDPHLKIKENKMNVIKYLFPLFKMFLPTLVDFFVGQAEVLITGAKKGTDKKAHVINAIERIATQIGIEGELDYLKLGILLEETVDKLFNKI